MLLLPPLPKSRDNNKPLPNKPLHRLPNNDDKNKPPLRPLPPQKLKPLLNGLLLKLPNSRDSNKPLHRLPLRRKPPENRLNVRLMLELPLLRLLPHPILAIRPNKEQMILRTVTFN
jgi:hypothetical protein